MLKEISATVLFGTTTAWDVVLASVVIIGSAVLAKLLALYLRRLLKGKIKLDHLEIIIKAVSYLIGGVAVVYVLSFLGVNLSGLLVAGGIAGVVVGFASQSVVGNLISGIFLIIERPIKIGDQVRIDDNTGFVEDIRIISTTIRTYDGLYVRIPNEKIFTSNIINFVHHVVRRFEYVVGIRYSDNADTAISTIRDIIDRHPFALKNPKPQAFVDNLGDNAVNIIVRVWAPVSEWYSVKMELLWKIKSALEQQGIEIAFPQRVVWFGKDPAAGSVRTPGYRENP